MPNVIELIGDIFETELGTSLAHCVSVDMKMNKGIALEFSRKYGRLDELQLQNNSVTEIVSIREGNRYIFYLLTKEHQWQRPSYENLFKSLQNLKVRCKELQVTKLACPRLGCGLDRLSGKQYEKLWDSSSMIHLCIIKYTSRTS